MRFMTAIHQALVNNDFDNTGTWGPKSLVSAEVSKRVSRKSPGKQAFSPKHPIVMLPKLQSPGDVKHELVVMSKTKQWLNKVRRREIKPNAKANKRCVQCKIDGRPDSFTKWVCLGCGYVYLCNPKTKRKATQNCFMKYHHHAKKLDVKAKEKSLGILS